MTPDEQFAALNVLDFVSDLFTAAGIETFRREDILVILNHVKDNQELFDPDVRIAQQIATADVG